MDPGLNSSNVNTNCEYTGSAVDMYGVLMDPDEHNYMSYSRKSCRNSFSNQQIDKINFWANHSIFNVLPTGKHTYVLQTFNSDQTISNNVVDFYNSEITGGADIVVDACGKFIISGSFEAANGTTLKVYVD